MQVGRPKKRNYAIITNDDSLFWKGITIQKPQKRKPKVSSLAHILLEIRLAERGVTTLLLTAVKRRVVTSLVDRAFQICSPRFLDSELDHLRDILFGNGYSISLINSVIEKRIKRLSDSDTVKTNQRENSVYIGLPYVKGVSEHISKDLTKHNIYTYYRPTKNISF